MENNCTNLALSSLPLITWLIVLCPLNGGFIYYHKSGDCAVKNYRPISFLYNIIVSKKQYYYVNLQ